jgi:hypothetical protein
MARFYAYLVVVALSVSTSSLYVYAQSSANEINLSQDSHALAVDDYSVMYEAVNPSIAKIFSDSGFGSGFLIDVDGLIATNHHVVANSRYLAVQFAEGLKYEAVAALVDPQHDIAILKVNEEVTRGLKPLLLLPGTTLTTLKPGIPVVAFGSPLSQTFLVTHGILSKVEDSVLVGDFLIEPGSSGGPLLNMAGEVIGINTFGVGGIAGAVRVEFLKRLIPTVRNREVAEPAAEPLPMMLKEKYPTEVLKERVILLPIDDDAYEIDGGSFDITALTPVSIGRAHIGTDLRRAANRMSRRGSELGDQAQFNVDGLFYEWERKASRWLDYVVRFEIKPEYGATTGSNWLTIASAVAAGLSAGFSGDPLMWVPPHQNLEFKAEFLDFRIYRDGELVEPITPGREITERAFMGYDMTFIDEAYSGMYVYSPKVFMEGEKYLFQVYDATEPNRIHKMIRLDARSKLIRQIRADFDGTDLGVASDDAETVRLAEQGDPEAQYNLGLRYTEGLGLLQDHAEALRWYRLAAEQGFSKAESALGEMYLTGDGVSQDHIAALQWFRLAVDQGDARGQYNLGKMYYNGEGVQQDHTEAARWIELAADQGHVDAQGALGEMYLTGDGVSQDHIAAHLWSSLAGGQLVGQARDSALRIQLLALRSMTADQVAEAQLLAREWNAAHPREP